MSALICGSIAFDTIMSFHDRFKNHILPEQVHILNISFLVPELRREFGGCAGNIAYNLKLLGEDPLPMATVGQDFGPYRQWLVEHAISTRYIKEIENSYTAQAYITSDLDDNQITAFHPGAMEFAHHNSVDDAEGVDIGIIAPDGREGMLEHAAQFDESGVPFIFDPGQGLPMFDGDELLNFIDRARWIAVNDYEGQLLQERTGLAPHDIAERADAFIVTLGGDGAHIYTRRHRIDIPPAKPARIADPTGCGDAFRAGLIYGLTHETDWETTGRIASLMGALKIEHHGTQNHRIDRAELEIRFKDNFGYAL